MNKKDELDLAKIFLSPPKSFFERFILFLLTTLLFVGFFRPLGLENMTFLGAIITASIPSITISWSWIVFLRFMFKREEYIK